MSTPNALAPAPERAWGLWLLVCVLVVTTLALLVVANGNPAAALAPTLGFALIYGLCKLPLRVPVLVLFFSAFVLEIPSDIVANGKWKSPIAIVGALLFGQLKATLNVGALVFMGIDVVLILLFAIHAYRRATGNTIDRQGAVALPMPLLYAAWASLGACIFAFLWGMAHGGSFRFSLWQIQRVIYIPLVFMLMLASFPRAQIYHTLAKLLIVAACLRSVLAIYLRRLFPFDEYATTHPDSMLFAIASCILIIRFLEERNRRSLAWMLALLPILVAGMVANDRRLVWVELGVALLFAFLLARRTKLKVRIVRGILYAVPALVAYIAAGWGSASGIFAPVATIRSVVDSKSDSSTRWRDLENFNLVSTIGHNPIIGTGWGHPYEMVVPMPDVTAAYELEPYAPHNSILGLWAYTGYVGFALHWLTLVTTVYFCARICFATENSEHRTVALTCLSAVIIYMVHLYGDLALGTWASVFLIASSMLISGKLAVEVGAWPSPNAARSPLTPRVEPLRRHP